MYESFHKLKLKTIDHKSFKKIKNSVDDFQAHEKKYRYI